MWFDRLSGNKVCSCGCFAHFVIEKLANSRKMPLFVACSKWKYE
nr:MAG TPA: envelope glycoprotein [Caudoviricetes sp.]DAM09133.1 MAG TPA: envelope glycoprotein [Bacteriophage sp.]